MKLSITRLNPSVTLPEYKTPGSVGFDLAAEETTLVASKTIALIPTGLVVKVPEGFMLMLASRSSTPLKKGLSPPHGIGVLDQDYCGPNDEVKIMVYNFTDSPVTIERGERIAQGVVVRIDRCEIIESSLTTDQSRGGYGSTGQ